MLMGSLDYAAVLSLQHTWDLSSYPLCGSQPVTDYKLDLKGKVRLKRGEVAR